MSDDGWLTGQRGYDVGEVLGYFGNGLAREYLRMCPRFRDRVRVIGPAGADRRVPLRVEERGPPVPARCQQPQTVDEHDRNTARIVGPLYLLVNGGGCLARSYGLLAHAPYIAHPRFDSSATTPS